MGGPGSCNRYKEGAASALDTPLSKTGPKGSTRRRPHMSDGLTKTSDGLDRDYQETI